MLIAIRPRREYVFLACHHLFKSDLHFKSTSPKVKLPGGRGSQITEWTQGPQTLSHKPTTLALSRIVMLVLIIRDCCIAISLPLKHSFLEGGSLRLRK